MCMQWKEVRLGFVFPLLLWVSPPQFNLEQECLLTRPRAGCLCPDVLSCGLLSWDPWIPHRYWAEFLEFVRSMLAIFSGLSGVPDPQIEWTPAPWSVCLIEWKSASWAMYLSPLIIFLDRASGTSFIRHLFSPALHRPSRPKIEAGRNCWGLPRLLGTFQAKAGLCPTAV